MNDALISSLERAVESSPRDTVLRLHLAEVLIAAARSDDAVTHLAAVLALDPGSVDARRLMAQALSPEAPTPEAPTPAAPTPAAPTPARGEGFDWDRAAADLGDVVPPMFLDGGGAEASAVPPGPAHEVERSVVRLADVGGMEQVKKRLEASFLAPLRNPELRALYGKSLRGGLLLYGPPGCGKTYLARAIAGELDATFLAVSLSDVLDMYIGNSEKNVTELFEQARASAPCVLFLDEIDALGQKRSQTRNSAMRGAVNQLLTELDGVDARNEGVYVLAATNQPWDVDAALRRPGRLDRMLLVLPPDRAAREHVLRVHLRDRPVERIDLAALAKATDGYSGADLAHVCETAAEMALLDSVESGQVRMIGMDDLRAAVADVRPSIGPWLETARNVALYANADGEYDELAAFLRKRGRRG